MPDPIKTYDPLEVEDLADSQYTLEYSIDGGKTYNKVPALQNADYPADNPVLDDVTPTDAHHTVKEKVDYSDDSTIKGQFVYKEGRQAEIDLKTAYDTNKTLFWRQKFEDAPSLTCQYQGQVTKWSPKAEKKKKIRVDIEITRTSDLTPITP